MKRFAFAVLCGFFTFSSSHLLGQQVGTPRTFFAADYQKKIAAIVLPDNSLGFQKAIRDIHDAQPLPNGHWLLQTTFTEVIEVDAKGEQVWKYTPDESKGRVEIHAFRRLENGLTMIAESGPSRIIEVDSKGSVKLSIPLQVSKSDPHRDTRLVRVTPQGNYLVAHEGEKRIKEYDRKGQVVWEYEVGSQLYSAVRLANGNTLIGTGDGHRVIEVNPAKEIVWEIREKDLAGVTLAWITMVDRLPNGNTWIVNCHAGPENPQIIEVSTDKKVVWSFKDFERFGNALPVAVPLNN
jgi:outer membrane protein assembly factor BamB